MVQFPSWDDPEHPVVYSCQEVPAVISNPQAIDIVTESPRRPDDAGAPLYVRTSPATRLPHFKYELLTKDAGGQDTAHYTNKNYDVLFVFVTKMADIRFKNSTKSATCHWAPQVPNIP